MMMKAGRVRSLRLGARTSIGWALRDAKGRFSEVVRRAREEGPQRITSHGKDAVVVVKAEEFDRLKALDESQPNLHAFFSNSPLKDLDLNPASERSPVREIEL